jgi:tetratricopeptide (TPR) repeat protein
MKQVFLMENHDEAYSRWHDAQVKNRILIHIDAHHDMWWIPEHTPTTIANFICLGLKEEMVREVFWVVPDQTWESPKSRKAVFRHLSEIIANYPQSQRAQQTGERKISAGVLGKPLTVCSIDGLPSISEQVLLDIDVDYLVIPSVSYGGGDSHGPLPWRWPNELLGALSAGGIRSDLATVSHSVEGGYTPLKWKYLGDELVARLAKADPNGPLLTAVQLIRAGAEATVAGDLSSAEQKYLDATEASPNFAASHYHLARLYLETNRIMEARACYQQAVRVDPSYRTAFNTAGLLRQSGGDYKKIEREIILALQLDSTDAYAHYGWGRIAGKRKQWDVAEASLNRAVGLDDQLIDAHRALGRLRVRQHRYDEAIRSYESAMKLALAGHAPLDGPIITNDGSSQIFRDPDHVLIHTRLAYLHDLKGEAEKAITGYRLSIAGGYDRIWVRARLARLYLRRQQRREAVKELWQAIKSTPATLRRLMNGLRWKLRWTS